jgi:hypothetical protein
MYRVLKGIDPDSVYVRLATGGTFEVRHSASNAAVFKVTDQGAGGSVSIPAGSVGSAEIADGSIVDADVNASANVAVSKLAASGTANRVLATAASAPASWQQVIAAMIANNNVLAGHIWPGGAANANRVLRSTDGNNSAWGQVQGGDIAPNNVVAGHIWPEGAGNANKLLRTTDGTNTSWGIPNTTMLGGSGAPNTVLRTNDGINPLFGQVQNGDIAANAVDSSKIADGSIVNADVNAAAALALSKLAPGAAGVLKSNGTTISAGNLVVTGDMAANTINGDRIADASITSAKLTGASVPAGSITTTEIADGTIQNVDVNAAANIAVSKLAAAGSAWQILGTGASAPAAWQQLNDQMVPVQGISLSKLFGGGTASRVAATNDGSNSVWAQVATAMIVQGAISQWASASGTAGATISSTLMTPIPGASVSLNPVNGGPVLVMIFGSAFCNLAGYLTQYQATYDGTPTGPFLAVTAAAANTYHMIGVMTVLQPAAGGAHSFGAAWSMGSAGATSQLSNVMVYALEIKR